MRFDLNVVQHIWLMDTHADYTMLKLSVLVCWSSIWIEQHRAQCVPQIYEICTHKINELFWKALNLDVFYTNLRTFAKVLIKKSLICLFCCYTDDVLFFQCIINVLIVVLILIVTLSVKLYYFILLISQ
jgi:hypothetical protein